MRYNGVMARGSQTATEFYSDLDNRNPGNVTNIDAVKQSIFNLLRTSKGERIFEPEIGVEIENLLFEPGDPVFRAYAMSVLNDLVSQEPRVSIEDLEVDFVEDQNEARMVLRVVVRRVGRDEGAATIYLPIE